MVWGEEEDMGVAGEEEGGGEASGAAEIASLAASVAGGYLWIKCSPPPRASQTLFFPGVIAGSLSHQSMVEV